MKKEKIIKVGNTVKIMQNASIGEETRNLLMVKATLMDAVDGLYKWIGEKYGDVKDKESDSIYHAQDALHKIIDRYLVDNIYDNMSMSEFKDI